MDILSTACRQFHTSLYVCVWIGEKLKTLLFSKIGGRRKQIWSQGFTHNPCLGPPLSTHLTSSHHVFIFTNSFILSSPCISVFISYILFSSALSVHHLPLHHISSTVSVSIVNIIYGMSLFSSSVYMHWCREHIPSCKQASVPNTHTLPLRLSHHVYCVPVGLPCTTVKWAREQA